MVLDEKNVGTDDGRFQAKMAFPERNRGLNSGCGMAVKYSNEHTYGEADGNLVRRRSQGEQPSD